MRDVVFFSSRRRHTRYWRDWSSDVCSSDLKNRDDPLPKPVLPEPCSPRLLESKENPTVVILPSSNQKHFLNDFLLKSCYILIPQNNRSDEPPSFSVFSFHKVEREFPVLDRKSTRLNSSH